MPHRHDPRPWRFCWALRSPLDGITLQISLQTPFFDGSVLIADDSPLGCSILLHWHLSDVRDSVHVNLIEDTLRGIFSPCEFSPEPQHSSTTKLTSIFVDNPSGRKNHPSGIDCSYVAHRQFYRLRSRRALRRHTNNPS